MNSDNSIQNFSILGRIQYWFASGPFCVRVSRKLVSITNLSNGEKWEDEPLIAVATKDRKKIVSAIGSEAKKAGGLLINPFDHPRILISNFMLGEKLLQHGFRRLSENKWISPSPVVVIQVLEKLEGGLSRIEERALMEMAAGAGARKVYVLKPPEMTDAEIKRGLYKLPSHNASDSLY